MVLFVAGDPEQPKCPENMKLEEIQTLAASLDHKLC